MCEWAPHSQSSNASCHLPVVSMTRFWCTSRHSLQMCEKSSINYIQLMFIDVNSIEAAQFDRFEFTISDRTSNRVGLSFNVIGSPALSHPNRKCKTESSSFLPNDMLPLNSEQFTFQHIIIIYSIRQSYSPFSFLFVPHFSCRVVD